MTKMIKKSTTTPLHNHQGFTLAETLITLVIIGIVAALTVPNMIVNYQKEQTVTKLKKVYSTLSQSTNKAIADNGPIETWTVETLKTKEFFEKYMLPYLSVAKDCGYETTGSCRFEKAELSTPKNKSDYSNIFYRVILMDGTALLMYTLSYNHNAGNGITIPRSYLVLHIDINGQKEPNVIGKDIFVFAYWIQNDWSRIEGQYDWSGKFLPNGATPATSNKTRENYKTSSCNKNGTGMDCAALIMADNWEIKDDYPW